MFFSEPEVEANAFRVPDMKVSIGLGRKPGLNIAKRPAARSASIACSMKFFDSRFSFVSLISIAPGSPTVGGK